MMQMTLLTNISSNGEVSNIPSLVCALLASLTSGGTVYAFGMYGDELKKNLHLSQTQLDTISTSLFIAGIIGWIPGIIVDKFGPRISLIIAGIIGAISTILFWLFARQIIYPNIDSSTIITTLSILAAIMYMSCSLIIASCFKVIMTSCHRSKGQAVGICKAYVGLGAGIYVGIFSLFAPHYHMLDFLLLTAFMFLFAVTVPALLLLPQQQYQCCNNKNNNNTSNKKKQKKYQPITYRDDTTLRHYQLLYASLFVLIFLILLQSCLQLFQNTTGNDDTEDNDTTTKTTMMSTIFNHKLLGVLIAITWVGPIQYLLYLPLPDYGTIENDHDDVIVDDDGDYDEEDDYYYEDLKDHNQQYCDVELESLPPSETTKLITPTTITTTASNNDIHNIIRQVQPPPSSAESISTTSTTFSIRGTRIATSSSAASLSSTEMMQVMSTYEEDSNTNTMKNAINDNDDEEPNYTILEMLQTPSAYLLLFTCVILGGNGVVETNNMGQMIESLHFDNPEKITQASLALFSVAQATARVMAGSCSEFMLQQQQYKYVGRPIFLLIASLIAFSAHLVLASAIDELTFVFGVVLSGIGFGMTWPLMVLIVGEIFGKINFGGNYMVFDGCTISFGAIIFSDYLAGQFYELHVGDDNNNEDVVDEYYNNEDFNDELTTCYGLSCFRTTHIIISFLALISALTSCVLLYTTRDVYTTIQRRLHRHRT